MAKSEKQKKLEGTDRADRKRKPIEFSDKWPEAAEFIQGNEVAMHTYGIICKHLAKYRLLADADSMVISQAAMNWANYVKYATTVSEVGIYHEVGEHGTRQVSPEYTAMKDAMKSFEKSQDLLGLSPKARKLMSEMFVEPEEKDEAKDPMFRVMKNVANG